MTQQFATAVMGSSSLSRPQLEQLDGIGIESRDEADYSPVVHQAFGWWRVGTSTANWNDQINFYCWDGDPTSFGTTGACRLANGISATNNAASGTTNRFVGDQRYHDEGFYLPPGAMLPGSILNIKVRGNVRNNAGADRTVFIVLDPDSDVRSHGITGLSLGDWAADATNDQLDSPSPPSFVLTGQRIEVWDADTTGLSTSTLYFARAVDADDDGEDDAIELFTDMNFAGTKVNLAAGTATIATASNVFGNASNSGNTITLTAHGLAVGETVQLYSKGAGVPTGSSEHANYTVATVPSADSLTLTGLTLSSNVSGFGIRRQPIGSKYAVKFGFTIPHTTYTSRTGYELDICGASDVGNQQDTAELDAVTWTGVLRIGSATIPTASGGGVQSTSFVDKSSGGTNTYDWGIRETIDYEVAPSGTINAGMFMVGSTSGAYGLVIEHDTLLRKVHLRPLSKDKRFRFGETITCYTPAGNNAGAMATDGATFTAVDLNANTVRVVSHGLSANDAVRIFPQVRTILPAPLSSSTLYYAEVPTTSTIRFYTGSGPTGVVTITANGAGHVVRDSGKVTFTAKTVHLASGVVMGFRFAPGEANAAAGSGLEFNIHDVSVSIDRIRARGS